MSPAETLVSAPKPLEVDDEHQTRKKASKGTRAKPNSKKRNEENVNSNWSTLISKKHLLIDPPTEKDILARGVSGWLEESEGGESQEPTVDPKKLLFIIPFRDLTPTKAQEAYYRTLKPSQQPPRPPPDSDKWVKVTWKQLTKGQAEKLRVTDLQLDKPRTAGSLDVLSVMQRKSTRYSDPVETMIREAAIKCNCLTVGDFEKSKEVIPAEKLAQWTPEEKSHRELVSETWDNLLDALDITNDNFHATIQQRLLEILISKLRNDKAWFLKNGAMELHDNKPVWNPVLKEAGVTIDSFKQEDVNQHDKDLEQLRRQARKIASDLSNAEKASVLRALGIEDLRVFEETLVREHCDVRMTIENDDDPVEAENRVETQSSKRKESPTDTTLSIKQIKTSESTKTKVFPPTASDVISSVDDNSLSDNVHAIKSPTSINASLPLQNPEHTLQDSSVVSQHLEHRPSNISKDVQASALISSATATEKTLPVLEGDSRVLETLIGTAKTAYSGSEDLDRNREFRADEPSGASISSSAGEVFCPGNDESFILSSLLDGDAIAEEGLGE